MDKKNESPLLEGAKPTKLAGGVGANKDVFSCSVNHINKDINKVVEGLCDNGVALRSTSGKAQVSKLLKALQFRGSLVLNTYEGTAAGYARLATRIQELEEEWETASQRETVLGSDGLLHKGVGRFILIGKKIDLPSAQAEFELEGA